MIHIRSGIYQLLILTALFAIEFCMPVEIPSDLNLNNEKISICNTHHFIVGFKFNLTEQNSSPRK